MPTIHLLIKGRVHGVFYRASAKDVAGDLHLSGWVKNTAEGDVEITATGNPESLQKFVDWCETGPAYTNVVSVLVSEIDEKPFKGFSIIR